VALVEFHDGHLAGAIHPRQLECGHLRSVEQGHLAAVQLRIQSRPKFGQPGT
jgi:hypothetical protein